MAAGAALLAACMATQPPNIALCAMGALAMMQGGHDSGAAGESAATYGASAYQNPGSNAGGSSATTEETSPADPAKGTAGFASASVEKGLATLKEAGYQVTPAGVTSPDGTFTPASSFGSPSSMAAAGFDAGAIRDAKRVTDAINDEIGKNGARVSGVATASSGGGGGDYSGAGGGGDGGAGGNTSAHLTNPFGLDGAAQKKLMAGKTVNFDGVPIGVRGDNIFEMVHDCYQKKRTGNQFIEGEGPVQQRLPASLPMTGLPKLRNKRK
jgi:hypothetical protein